MRDIDKIDSHIFVTASSSDTLGNTFCDHLAVGIEITVQGIVSFIISLLTLRIASERALFAIATLLESTSVNKSGVDQCIEISAAPSSSHYSWISTCHLGTVFKTSCLACLNFKCVIVSSAQLT